VTPGLRQRDTVVMNFRFHKRQPAPKGGRAAGIERLHLAAYSADLNPTVLAFAKGEPLL
jgi:hypothetical protein